MTVAIDPAPIAPALEKAFSRLDASSFAEALWSRRLDVWTADTAVQQKIANRLGWLDVVESMVPQLPRLRACAQSVRDAGITDVVLLGMGGSSLGPEVLRNVFGAASGFPRFRVLDSVDPDAVRDALDQAATSLFMLASKSGTTIEPNSMAAEAERRLRLAGITETGSRFIAITDEHTALHARALEHRFRDVFINPADIGGRYSVLSLFGLVPAAIMGIDVDALMAAAQTMRDACRASDPRTNPGLALGAAMAAAALTGRDKLTLRMPDQLESFGLWVEQLVAESTGKQGKGVVPIAGEPLEVPLGDDRFLVSVTLPTPLDLGAEFFCWEVATATAGFLLDINPFDEPNVKQAKDATGALLETYTAKGRLPAPEPHASLEGVRLTLSNAAQDGLAGEDALAFLRLIRPGDYFGLLAYLPPEDEQLAFALREFRARVGRIGRCATMLGYGPRYLHSTGQLHKGGANSGVFVIVTAALAEDLAIPGAPYSFGVLEQAQAVGDFQSLDRAGRRVMHLHLPQRDAQSLQMVFARL